MGVGGVDEVHHDCSLCDWHSWEWVIGVEVHPCICRYPVVPAHDVVGLSTDHLDGLVGDFMGPMKRDIPTRQLVGFWIWEAKGNGIV